MSKLKLWQKDWDEAEKNWNSQCDLATKQQPIKKLRVLPDIPGITKETAKNLKWKSLFWMLTKDHKGEVRRGFVKHPFKYLWAFLKSVFKTKPFKREGDFFLYGVKSMEDFEILVKNPQNILVLGFSYCHKPFECPSGRFTDQCQNDIENPVCQQCFIGKAVQASAEAEVIPLFIPTIHYIGGKIFEIVHANSEKQILFIITACEMTLEMFGDWGNMVNIKGIGVRLDGRICNTMKAFELSERGIKPGLTVVLDDTQKSILQLIRQRLEKVNNGCRR